MKTENKTLLLRDPAIEPTARVLEEILGTEIYRVYLEILDVITLEFGLEHEWRYYNDGKSWLFKAVHKKKTVFWLSIWETYIKTGFFFTEKTGPGIFDLPIADTLKEDFRRPDTAGKFRVLSLDIVRNEQLPDFREIVRYKKSLK